MTKEQTITSGALQCTLPPSGPRGMFGWLSSSLTATEWIFVLSDTVADDWKIPAVAKSSISCQSSCPACHGHGRDRGLQLERVPLRGMSRADAKHHGD